MARKAVPESAVSNPFDDIEPQKPAEVPVVAATDAAPIEPTPEPVVDIELKATAIAAEGTLTVSITDETGVELDPTAILPAQTQWLARFLSLAAENAIQSNDVGLVGPLARLSDRVAEAKNAIPDVLTRLPDGELRDAVLFLSSIL